MNQNNAQTFIISGPKIQPAVLNNQQLNPKQQKFSQNYNKFSQLYQQNQQKNVNYQSYLQQNRQYPQNHQYLQQNRHYPQQNRQYLPSQQYLQQNRQYSQNQQNQQQNRQYSQNQNYYQNQQYQQQNRQYSQNQQNQQQNRQYSQSSQNQQNQQSSQNKSQLKEEKKTSEKKKLTPDQYWLNELKENPQDETILVSGHLNMIFSQNYHKFSKSIPDFVQNIKSSRNLSNLKKNPQDDNSFNQLIESIKGFTVHLIKQIDSHYGNLRENNISPKFYSLARVVIEEKIWLKIFDDVYPIFQKRNQEDDQVYLKQMDTFRTLILPHFGVKQLFWLIPDENNPVVPYSSAISLFLSISSIKSPISKIKCLSKVAKEIVNCIKKCWEGRVERDQLDIGADDLIPLMSYVIIKSNVLDLGSQCSFMETFVDDQFAIEEGGYMIATFQTCLSFISCLSKEEVENSATEIYEKAEQKQFQIKKIEEKIENINLNNSSQANNDICSSSQINNDICSSSQINNNTDDSSQNNSPKGDLIEW